MTMDARAKVLFWMTKQAMFRFAENSDAIKGAVMLSKADLHDQFKQSESLSRRALDHCVPKGFKPTLGKHQAVNHEQMRRTIEKAATECPDAAAVITWLLWHKVLDDQRMVFLSNPDEST